MGTGHRCPICVRSIGPTTLGIDLAICGFCHADVATAVRRKLFQSPQTLLTRGSKMLGNTLKRIVLEEDGMEMVEWAIVGVVFAVAAAVFWTDLGTAVDGALGQIETSIARAP